MKFHHRWAVTALFIVALGASSIANGALVSRLGGAAVYDTDLNITWLANANLAGSNDFGVSGIGCGVGCEDAPLAAGYTGWFPAQSWIGAMNTANYLGYHDWRLPTTLYPDATCSDNNLYASYNCTGSEMGELFYNELGGVAGTSITTTHNANYNLFQNVQSTAYWSGTDSTGTGTHFPQDNAFTFDFANGAQALFSTESRYQYMWAVRPGDVAAVPVPAAVWLFGSGLLGLIAVTRHRAA